MQIADIVKTSPSLRAYARQKAGDQYTAGRLLAASETGIAFGLLPEECPFTPDEVADPDYFPEDRSIE